MVLFHGLLMTGTLWDEVVAALPPDLRVVRPTWPLGAHRLPLQPGADRSLRGHARLIGEFLEALDLHDATLVFADWCGAQLLIAEDLTRRVGRLMLVGCETDDNYPPGVPGRTAVLAARIPGGVSAALQVMRIRPARRLPTTFGWMAKRPIPDEKLDRWLRPGRACARIRRDLVEYAADAANGQRALAAANAAMARFSRPVLVVWGSEDRVMPLGCGRRLAGRSRTPSSAPCRTAATSSRSTGPGCWRLCWPCSTTRAAPDVDPAGAWTPRRDEPTGANRDAGSGRLVV